MYIKKGINFSETTLSGLNLSTIDIEIHWVTIKLPKL